MLTVAQNRFPSSVTLYRVDGVLYTKKELNAISSPRYSWFEYFSNWSIDPKDLFRVACLVAAEELVRYFLATYAF